jgi:hypothetical protein
MKTFINQKIKTATFLSIAILLLTSCTSPLKLTSSWTNKQAKVKSSPQIMVMVLGKANSTAPRDFENSIVSRLKKDGYKAIAASEILQAGKSKIDSAELVNILRKNNIDILLTNAVVSITENEKFIPGAVQGTSVAVPGGGYATPYNPYYSVNVGYNNYYNYYNFYNSTQIIDAPPTPGTTVTDVKVIIESKLYKVETPELIWYGQSRSYTKDPTPSLINAFSKMVISDIRKNKLLVK